MLRNARLRALNVLRRRLLGIIGVPLAFGLDVVSRRSSRRAGVALVYHAVADRPGDLRRELVPALGTRLFEKHIRYLARRYRMVLASDLLDAARSRSPGVPFPLALTFDDDLSSHLAVVAPMCREWNVPAAFYLTGRSLRGPAAYWWEDLQRALDAGIAPEALGVPGVAAGVSIHKIGGIIERLAPTERRAVEEHLRRLAGPGDPAAGLRTTDVSRLSALGFEIGFHTLRHDRLTDLEDESMRRAFLEGRDELHLATRTPIDSIAYPHGRADERVAHSAQAAGFRVGFTGTPTVVTPDSNPLLLGRVSPSYDSVGELAFDVAWTIFRTSSP